LWSDPAESWQDISEPFNITKWALQSSTDELAPVDLEQYLFSANGSSFKLVPFAYEPVTKQDQPASFPPVSQDSASTLAALSGSLTVGDLPCPIRVDGVQISSSNDNPAMLHPLDTLSVSFQSTIAPVRVKICGRWQAEPFEVASNNDINVYSFELFSQPEDEQGPCNLMVYLPMESGILAVYEQPTGVSVECPTKGKAMRDNLHVHQVSDVYVYTHTYT